MQLLMIFASAVPVLLAPRVLTVEQGSYRRKKRCRQLSCFSAVSSQDDCHKIPWFWRHDSRNINASS